MTKALTLLFFVSLCVYVSCKKNKSIDELKTEFNNRKKDFDKLILTLRKNSRLDTLIWNKEYINGKMKYSAPDTYNALKTLGVTEINSFQAIGCGQIHQYDLATNWEAKFPIHFTFNTCDTSTKEGYYRKDQNSNEFWGLGNDWQMWREVKLLAVKQ